MARKKASTRKKTTAKKNNQKGSGSTGVLILVLLLAAGIVFYGVNETGEFAGETATPTATSPKPKKETSTQPAPTEKVEKQASKGTTIDRKDISSQDGLVEKSTTNERVPEYEASKEYYYTSSFDFSWPAYTQQDAIVEHQYYTLCYDEKHEQARWVAYKLTAQNLSNGKYKRKDNFKADPDVMTQSASVDDYKKSGYDRGHLAPAADFTWTEEGLDESFYMSNMSPQEPGFNRGIWKKLEEQVRVWAKENHTLYIVTGPLIDNRTKRIGKNKVSVPQYYYKAILDINEPELKAIGFLLKNEKSSADLMTFALSIDELEKRTGLDFFPLIPDSLEEKLEKEANKNLWK